MTKRALLVRTLVSLAVLLGALPTVWAGVPETIHYQGYLTGPNGEGVTGTFPIRFAVYASEGATEPFWSTTPPLTVIVKNGVFRVSLGPLPSAEVQAGNLWLGLTVNPDANSPEMAPRMRLESAPYALAAGHAEACDQVAGMQDVLDRLEQAEASIATLTANQVPPGTIIAYAGTTIPEGWLLCDGSPYSRTVLYADLFEAIGETYGAGDGSTTFNVPDLKGRAVVGIGQGNGLTNRSLGERFGEESHQLKPGEMPLHAHSLPNHGHVLKDPGHEHDVRARDGDRYFSYTAEPGADNSVAADDVSSYHNNGLFAARVGTGAWVAEVAWSDESQKQGGDEGHNNMQPSLALKYIIRY